MAKNQCRKIGLDLAKNSRYGEIIGLLDERANSFGCTPLEKSDFPSKYPNCIGTVMHITGNTKTLRALAERERLRNFFVAEPEESRPGYFAPYIMTYFLEDRASRVPKSQEATDDIIIFFGRGIIQHAALYLGSKGGKRVMFGQPDWARPLEFSEADLYAQEEPVTHYEFYRLKV